VAVLGGGTAACGASPEPGSKARAVSRGVTSIGCHVPPCMLILISAVVTGISFFEAGKLIPRVFIIILTDGVIFIVNPVAAPAVTCWNSAII